MPRTWSRVRPEPRPGSEINSEKTPDMSGALTQHFMRIQHMKTQDGQLQSKLLS